MVYILIRSWDSSLLILLGCELQVGNGGGGVLRYTRVTMDGSRVWPISLGITEQ